jgi:RimJ/RimL family protein N-acetyltransferase
MVNLVPLTEEEYQSWYAWLLEDYARDFERLGASPAEAKERSRAELEETLSAGLASPDQYFYAIADAATGQHVGVVWFILRTGGARRSVFLAELVVYEPLRGQGYGTGALRALEDQARALGADRIGLHVFGHNRAAWELYRRLGYRETHVQMVKDLPG